MGPVEYDDYFELAKDITTPLSPLDREMRDVERDFRMIRAWIENQEAVKKVKEPEWDK